MAGLEHEIGELLPWTTQWVSADLRGTHHYGAAPITEAVIEVRFESDELRSLSELRSLCASLEGWQDADVKQLFNGSVELREDGEAAATTEPAGFQLRRSDEARSLHVLPDRIAFAWNAPYEDWDLFIGEWWRVWEPYSQFVSPKFVTRVAARFVNLIKIPKAQIEISDYLRTTVNISPVLPQAVRTLFMQVDVPLVASGDIGAIVTSTLAATDDPRTSALVLDLDTYDQRRTLIGSDLRRSISSRLDMLRTAKNYVFEASITDATRGLIS